jgi:hypothetical protein
MNSDGHRQSFHLEITGLEEFATFVAILRGDDLSTLPALTAKLRHSTEALAAAEAAAVNIGGSPST